MSRLSHRIAQRMLRSTGRAYEISGDIPSSWIWGELAGRAVQLARGVIRLRSTVFLGRGVRLRGARSLHLASGVSIGDRSVIDARGTRGVVMRRGSRLGRNGIVTTTSHLSLLGVGLELGENSGVGDFFHIGCSGGVVIGSDVIIGPYLTVHSQEHNYADPSVPIRTQGTTQQEVVVGDDCWLGARVTLLAGTTLGPRTIVAAGAVVRGNHPGNEVLGGVPAKRIREL